MNARVDDLGVHAFQAYEERAREVGESVAAARSRPLAEAALSPRRAQEWVDAFRADRDR